ncbi:hypothetical protein V474_23005 [Novosphingobium barchaimii LL02]|uniref:Uncharacterized protein n=1 Tax=Novosphingobium barchaimii LL02 TaxID=1114963 RepID=A0A0J8AFG7_9SPHN|nr:hypothetical protein V474_23005 [Novosphingobium barchaimii LL02]
MVPEGRKLTTGIAYFSANARSVIIAIGGEDTLSNTSNAIVNGVKSAASI